MKKGKYIVISIICIVLIWSIADEVNITNYNNSLKSFYEKYSGLYLVLKCIVCTIIVFVIKYLDKIIKIVQEFCGKYTEAIISVNIDKVTNIRKTKNKDYTPEIVISTGRFFIYIKCIMKNISSISIKNIFIGNRKIEFEKFDANTEKIFYLRICAEKEKEIYKNRKIIIRLEDEKANTYNLIYKIICKKNDIEIKLKKIRGERKYA